VEIAWARGRWPDWYRVSKRGSIRSRAPWGMHVRRGARRGQAVLVQIEPDRQLVGKGRPRAAGNGRAGGSIPGSGRGASAADEHPGVKVAATDREMGPALLDPARARRRAQILAREPAVQRVQRVHLALVGS